MNDQITRNETAGDGSLLTDESLRKVSGGGRSALVHQRRRPTPLNELPQPHWRATGEWPGGPMVPDSSTTGG